MKTETTEEWAAAMAAVGTSPPGSAALMVFLQATCERHAVHLAPWTAALMFDFCVALDQYSRAMQREAYEETMKLSKWLRDSADALQESLIKAGTPAPSGPAELYQALLAAGFRALTVNEVPILEPLPIVPIQETLPCT